MSCFSLSLEAMLCYAMLLLTPSKYYHLAFGPVLKICFALGTLREPFYLHTKTSAHSWLQTKND
jgi:hypothetical protein